MLYCSQHNVQDMFKSRNLSPNMPKSTLLSIKNRKNRPALGVPPPDPLCLRRLGVRLQTPAVALISLRIPCYALNYKAQSTLGVHSPA